MNAERYIAPWYARARELFGVLPERPIYDEDLGPGDANAEGKLEGGVPHFRWRGGYPSDTLDPDARRRETIRTACHEIGHPFEKLCLLLGIDVHRLFGLWRGLDWKQWEAWGRQPREFFADAFGAALSGEWITPIGLSEADRHRYELPTVTPQEARGFFLSLVGRGTMTIDLRAELPQAEWEIGRSAKTSATIHWPAALDPITDPLGALWGYATYHMTKDWSLQSGVQNADGIQYTRAVDQWGTKYILRDRECVLWHSDSADGNAASIPVLALLAINEEPTVAMLDALAETVAELGVPKFPHGPHWTATACPGPALRAWAQQEEDVAFKDDPDAITYREDVRATLEAIKAVLAALDARLDRISEAARG